MIKTVCLVDVLEEHAEEAAFLWQQRNDAVSSPDYDLTDLLELDDRIDAHLEGLRVAGDAGRDICREVFTWGEKGEIFAAAVLAFESGDEKHQALVWKAIEDSPELAGGVVSALGWLDQPKALAIITRFAASKNPLERCAGIGGAAVHRFDPGPALEKGIEDQANKVKARALRAAGELGRLNLLPHLRKNLSIDNEECRFAAAWSATLLGDMTAVTVLESFADSERHCNQVADLVFRRLPMDSAQKLQTRLATESCSMRSAIVGAGAIGDPMAVPWLIEKMNDEILAPAAGDAFAMLTGANIGEDGLELVPPQERTPEANEESETQEEEEPVQLAEDNLNVPDPKLVEQWWSKNRHRFVGGTRYLSGLPLSMENLKNVLRSGSQRRRAAAALELALSHPGQVLFETRARADLQLMTLRS